jgi:hypothetical protein
MSALTITGLFFTGFMVALAVFAHVGRKITEKHNTRHHISKC